MFQFKVFNLKFSIFNPSIAALLLFAFLALATNARAEEQKFVWDPAGIEDFSLTECHGQTVTKADLLGKPWLACFVFTRCAGPCPRVSREMQILQDRTRDLDVRLVSFTVDPETDTPEVLRTYAEFYKADPLRWWFLTGDKEVIYRLIRRSFRMIVDEDPKQIPGFEVIHSTEIMHVDAEGVVRGRYNAQNDVAMARLRRALLGKSDPLDAAVIKEGEENERRQVQLQRQAEEAAERTLKEEEAAEALARVPAWFLRLPAVNASLNGLATVLLFGGWVLIKSHKPRAHKGAMLTAFAVSMAFLACYLVYHQQLRQWTGSGSHRFEGQGLIRPVYFTILITHVVLAAAVPILASVTIYRGLTSQWERHKRLARVTFPIWLYVSVTGVIIYFILYHWPAH
jgi:protein SCO1/2/putative membrane protein